MWRPLYSRGVQLERVQRVAIEVATRVAELTSDFLDDSDGASARIAEPGSLWSLSGGLPGFGVLLDYASRVFPEHDTISAPIPRLLDRLILALKEEPMDTGLYGGLSGVVWVIRMLAERTDRDSAEIDEVVLEVLLEYLRNPQARHVYDLVSGFTGVGLLVLDIPSSALQSECLDHLLLCLLESSAVENGGACWRTPRTMVPVHIAARFPKGYVNLGVAHGIPAALVVLSRYLSIRPEDARAAALLRDSLAYLRSVDVGSRERFSFHNQVPFEEGDKSRLAWCYGDIGVAAALSMVSRCPLSPELGNFSLELARRSLSRQISDSGVVDAQLCHGAAGLLHIYNRLGQVHADQQLLEAARTWGGVTLNFHAEGEGFAGFSEVRYDLTSMKPYRVGNPGFLSGSTGIALALCASVAAVPPKWDRLLALS